MEILYSEYVDKFYKIPSKRFEEHPLYIQYVYNPVRSNKICAIIVKHVNDYPEIKIRDLITSYIEKNKETIDKVQDMKIYKIDKYEDLIRKLMYKIKTIDNMINNKARMEEIMQLFTDNELDEIFNI